MGGLLGDWWMAPEWASEINGLFLPTVTDYHTDTCVTKPNLSRTEKVPVLRNVTRSYSQLWQVTAILGMYVLCVMSWGVKYIVHK